MPSSSQSMTFITEQKTEICRACSTLACDLSIYLNGKFGTIIASICKFAAYMGYEYFSHTLLRMASAIISSAFGVHADLVAWAHEVVDPIKNEWIL